MVNYIVIYRLQYWIVGNVKILESLMVFICYDMLQCYVFYRMKGDFIMWYFVTEWYSIVFCVIVGYFIINNSWGVIQDWLRFLSIHFLVYWDIFLNFEVFMLQYDVWSKLMNGISLLEYGVFIR